MDEVERVVKTIQENIQVRGGKKKVVDRKKRDEGRRSEDIRISHMVQAFFAPHLFFFAFTENA